MKVKALLINSASIAVISSSVAAQDVDNAALITQNGTLNKAIVQQTGTLNTVGLRDGADSIYAEQSGDQNRAELTQTGDNNSIGATGTGFVQSGDRNSVTIDQTQNRNVVGTINQIGTVGASEAQNSISVSQSSLNNSTPDDTSNIVSGLSQNNTTNGAANSITITQSRVDGGIAAAGVASANRIGSDGASILQEGAENSMTLSQTGLANLIADVYQGGGAGNIATISQDNSANTGEITGNTAGFTQNGTTNTLTITVTGDGNGANGLTARFASGVGATGSEIQQIGSSNFAEWNATGDGNEFGISQTGDSNRAGIAMISGNNNQTGFVQSGNANVISITDINNNDIDFGASQTGDANSITVGQLSGDNNALQLVQYGTNDMTFDVVGAGNTLKAQQGAVGSNGSGNAMTVSIAGTGNSTDYDGDQTNAANRLYQIGTDQTLDLVVNGADNLFKTAQSGEGHIANITLNGSSNKLSVSQLDLDNTYTIKVAGSSNDVTGMQNGSLNTLTADLTGARNTLNTMQIGSSNLMDLKINDSDGTFMITQDGNHNKLTANVQGNGSNTNMQIIEQRGDYNVAEFRQAGQRNSISVKQ